MLTIRVHPYSTFALRGVGFWRVFACTLCATGYGVRWGWKYVLFCAVLYGWALTIEMRSYCCKIGKLLSIGFNSPSTIERQWFKIAHRSSFFRFPPRPQNISSYCNHVSSLSEFKLFFCNMVDLFTSTNQKALGLEHKWQNHNSYDSQFIS